MFKTFRHHRFFPHIIWSLVIVLAIILIFISTKKAYSRFNIIDTHEHIQGMKQADELVLAMDNLGISKIALIPSPIETLTLNGRKTFTRYVENNNEILKIAKKYPERFIPFCTISPIIKDALSILEECHKNGGKGLKLYNGHSFYYDTFGIPLDSPVMDPIYAYAEKERLPVLYHVNLIQYGAQLENVLKKYPNLVVSIPHFMVSSADLTKVTRILDTYPNTYTDISFGYEPYAAAGIRRISADIQKFADFFEKYSDRILFGADMVLTDIQGKDQKYMETTLQCYKNVLERKRFSCKPVNDYYKNEAEKNKKASASCGGKTTDFCKSKKEKTKSNTRWYNETKTLNGLNLKPDMLKKIYEDNPERFLGVQ